MLNERPQADEVHPVKSFRSFRFLEVGSNPNELHLLVWTPRCLPRNWRLLGNRFQDARLPNHPFPQEITLPGAQIVSWSGQLFFPDRYVLRFGELSLWTGHREKFPAALKIEKTPLLLWVSPPPPSLLRSNSTSAGQLNFSSYQLP